MDTKWLVLAFLLIPLILGLGMLYAFATIGKLWLQSLLSGASISVMQIVAMKLRNSPVQKIVEMRIMAAQAGLPIRTAEIESAILRGVDVELAIRSLIRAKQTNVELTWEEALEIENKRWLAERLELL
ncbi:MAG: flotillin-like FloA family protein [Planctomycetaceae bacterium]|nr:flotillin-like FloA family protein [Planctomycetaceae bacterium]